MSKLTKLFKNPTLFFYDMLRKRIYGDTGSFDSSLGEPLQDLEKYRDINAVDKRIKELAKFSHNGILYFDNKSSLFLFLSQISFLLDYTITIITKKKANVYENKSINFYSIMKSVPNYNYFHIEIQNNESIKTFYIITGTIREKVFQSGENFGIKKIPVKNISTIKDTINFPIDIVYTYVDATNPQWRQSWIDTFGDNTLEKDRFESHNELKYSLRSVNMFMPWVNRIFIVSNCPPPEWLKLSDKIRWVSHEEIFPDTSCLPVFNSHAIEACLHRIPNLSEHFVYFNDDVFVNKELSPSTFFFSPTMSINFKENYDVAFWTKDTIEEVGYQSATIQVQNLLLKDFGYAPRYMMQHAPHAMLKSVLQELEKRYPKNFAQTRTHKIRDILDISTVSFLYPHYAFITGHSTHQNTVAAIVRDINYKQAIRKHHKYTFICFNAWYDAAYNQAVEEFFNTRYFVVPEWEKDA